MAASTVNDMNPLKKTHCLAAALCKYKFCTEESTPERCTNAARYYYDQCILSSFDSEKFPLCDIVENHTTNIPPKFSKIKTSLEENRPFINSKR